MRIIWTTGAVLAAFVAAATPCAAQVVDGQAPLPSRSILFEGQVRLPLDSEELARRDLELQQWIREFSRWIEWRDKWTNKAEPGWVSVRKRRPKPDPPVWLFDDCRDLADEYGHLADACRLLSQWKEDYPTTLMRRDLMAARAQHEAPTHSKWVEHIHFDGFWPMTQLHASVYGVLGMHATIDVAGRVQVFVAPGAILVNLPSANGGREWQLAADWGFGYRLFDFKFPGSAQYGTLHVNIAKARVLAGPDNLTHSSLTLAGFSVTLKKIR